MILSSLLRNGLICQKEAIKKSIEVLPSADAEKRACGGNDKRINTQIYFAWFGKGKYKGYPLPSLEDALWGNESFSVLPVVTERAIPFRLQVIGCDFEHSKPISLFEERLSHCIITMFKLKDFQALQENDRFSLSYKHGEVCSEDYNIPLEDAAAIFVPQGLVSYAEHELSRFKNKLIPVIGSEKILMKCDSKTSSYYYQVPCFRTAIRKLIKSDQEHKIFLLHGIRLPTQEDIAKIISFSNPGLPSASPLRLIQKLSLAGLTEEIIADAGKQRHTLMKLDWSIRAYDYQLFIKHIAAVNAAISRVMLNDEYAGLSGNVLVEFLYVAIYARIDMIEHYQAPLSANGIEHLNKIKFLLSKKEEENINELISLSKLVVEPKSDWFVSLFSMIRQPVFSIHNYFVNAIPVWGCSTQCDHCDAATNIYLIAMPWIWMIEAKKASFGIKLSRSDFIRDYYDFVFDKDASDIVVLDQIPFIYTSGFEAGSVGERALEKTLKNNSLDSVHLSMAPSAWMRRIGQESYLANIHRIIKLIKQTNKRLCLLPFFFRREDDPDEIAKILEEYIDGEPSAYYGQIETCGRLWQLRGKDVAFIDRNNKILPPQGSKFLREDSGSLNFIPDGKLITAITRPQGFNCRNYIEIKGWSCIGREEIRCFNCSIDCQGGVITNCIGRRSVFEAWGLSSTGGFPSASPLAPIPNTTLSEGWIKANPKLGSINRAPGAEVIYRASFADLAKAEDFLDVMGMTAEFILSAPKGVGNEKLIEATQVILLACRYSMEDVTPKTISALSRLFRYERILLPDISINDIYRNALNAVSIIRANNPHFITDELVMSLMRFLTPYELESWIDPELFVLAIRTLWVIGILPPNLTPGILRGFVEVLSNGLSDRVAVHEALTDLSARIAQPQDEKIYRIWFWFKQEIPFVLQYADVYIDLLERYQRSIEPRKFIEDFIRKAEALTKNPINIKDRQEVFLAFCGLQMQGYYFITFDKFSACMNIPKEFNEIRPAKDAAGDIFERGSNEFQLLQGLEKEFGSLRRFKFGSPRLLGPSELPYFGGLNIGIFTAHISEDTIALLQEAGRYGGNRDFMMLTENISFIDTASGRKVPFTNSGIFYLDGELVMAKFSEPIPLFYVIVQADTLGKSVTNILRTQDVPMPGSDWIVGYTEAKDITSAILNKNGIAVPKTISITVNNNNMLFASKRANYKEVAHMLRNINEQAQREILKKFSEQEGINNIVIKPTGGSGGESISFFNISTFEGSHKAVIAVSEILVSGRNAVIQERIIPPLVDYYRSKGLDWNLRVFNARGNRGNFVVSDCVVRLGKFGSAVNICKGAKVLTFEELARLLRLSQTEAVRFLAEIEKISIDSCMAIEAAMIEDGVLAEGKSSADFIGTDVIARVEGNRLVPYIMEVNCYNSGGMWDLNNHLQSISSKRAVKLGIGNDRIGRSCRDWVNTIFKRAEEFKLEIQSKGASPLVDYRVHECSLGSRQLASSKNTSISASSPLRERNYFIMELRRYAHALPDDLKNKVYPLIFTPLSGRRTLIAFIESLLDRLQKQLPIDSLAQISGGDLGIFFSWAGILYHQGKMKSLAFLLANMDGIHEAYEVYLREEISWLPKSSLEGAFDFNQFLKEIFEYGLCRGTTTTLVDYALRCNKGKLINPQYRDRILFTLVETKENYYWSNIACRDNDNIFEHPHYRVYKALRDTIRIPQPIILYFNIERLPMLRVYAGEKSEIVLGLRRDIAEVYSASKYRQINLGPSLMFGSKVKVIRALTEAGVPIAEYLYDQPDWKRAVQESKTLLSSSSLAPLEFRQSSINELKRNWFVKPRYFSSEAWESLEKINSPKSSVWLGFEGERPALAVLLAKKCLRFGFTEFRSRGMEVVLIEKEKELAYAVGQSFSNFLNNFASPYYFTRSAGKGYGKAFFGGLRWQQAKINPGNVALYIYPDIWSPVFFLKDTYNEYYHKKGDYSFGRDGWGGKDKGMFVPSEIEDLLPLRNLRSIFDNRIIADLGSADGRLIYFLASMFKEAKAFMGLEFDKDLYMESLLLRDTLGRKMNINNIAFMNIDFLKWDEGFRLPDVFYYYLGGAWTFSFDGKEKSFQQRLFDQFFRYARPGTFLIIYHPNCKSEELALNPQFRQYYQAEYTFNWLTVFRKNMRCGSPGVNTQIKQLENDFMEAPRSASPLELKGSQNSPLTIFDNLCFQTDEATAFMDRNEFSIAHFDTFMALSYELDGLWFLEELILEQILKETRGSKKLFYYVNAGQVCDIEFLLETIQKHTGGNDYRGLNVHILVTNILSRSLRKAARTLDSWKRRRDNSFALDFRVLALDNCDEYQVSELIKYIKKMGNFHGVMCNLGMATLALSIVPRLSSMLKMGGWLQVEAMEGLISKYMPDGDEFECVTTPRKCNIFSGYKGRNSTSPLGGKNITDSIISSRVASPLAERIESYISVNRVLSEPIVSGNKCLRGYVNPLSKEYVIASGWGGIDIANLWLATHFWKAYIINDFMLDVEKLRFHYNLWASFDSKLEYFVHKFDLGYNYTQDFHPVFGKEPEFFIIQELQGMGIRKEQIRIEEDDMKRVILSFVPFGIHEESKIIFVKDNILLPSEELNNELSGRLDAYYQKASEDFGFCYEEYLPVVIKWIKSGGFFIFNPFNQSGDCVIPYGLLSGFEWGVNTKLKLGMLQGLRIAAEVESLKAKTTGYGWAMVALQKFFNLTGGPDGNMRFTSLLSPQSKSRSASPLVPIILTREISDFACRQVDAIKVIGPVFIDFLSQLINGKLAGKSIYSVIRLLPEFVAIVPDTGELYLGSLQNKALRIGLHDFKGKEVRLKPFCFNESLYFFVYCAEQGLRPQFRRFDNYSARGFVESHPYIDFVRIITES
ncbi:MAG: ATP-grasp domain-containing protein [Candidatus Omnitrophota bacterium]